MIKGTVLLCIILLEYHTGYGIYSRGKQIECEYVEADIGGLHWVNCKRGMDTQRLSDNKFINNPLQSVRISETGSLKHGKECFNAN